MPIKIQKGLPAKAVLESENIFVMDEERAMSQDIRPLEILILNLMPIKEETETQLLRALSNTPLQIDCSFLMLSTHRSKNTSSSHLNKFYVPFSEICQRKYDGMIITGAPVEMMEFEEVTYWEELSMIMEWTKSHVTSTLHICWGAQAPLVRGMDDFIMAPHSRYTEVRKTDVAKHKELQILAESREAGLFLIMKQDGSQIFIQGHPEYDRMTLSNEYHRDVAKGLDPEIPCNYFEGNDPFSMPVLCWRNMATTLYSNWLNFYVYQETPYDLYGIQ